MFQVEGQCQPKPLTWSVWSRWSYFEGGAPRLALTGLTQLSSPVCPNSSTCRRAARPAAEGAQTHQEGAARSGSTSLLPFVSKLVRRIIKFFLKYTLLYDSPGWRSEFWISRRGQEAEEQRAALWWSSRAPGAQGARRTRSKRSTLVDGRCCPVSTKLFLFVFLGCCPALLLLSRPLNLWGITRAMMSLIVLNVQQKKKGKDGLK